MLPPTPSALPRKPYNYRKEFEGLEDKLRSLDQKLADLRSKPNSQYTSPQPSTSSDSLLGHGEQSLDNTEVAAHRNQLAQNEREHKLAMSVSEDQHKKWVETQKQAIALEAEKRRQDRERESQAHGTQDTPVSGEEDGVEVETRAHTDREHADLGSNRFWLRGLKSIKSLVTRA